MPVGEHMLVRTRAKVDSRGGERERERERERYLFHALWCDPWFCTAQQFWGFGSGLMLCTCGKPHVGCMWGLPQIPLNPTWSKGRS